MIRTELAVADGPIIDERIMDYFIYHQHRIHNNFI